MQNKHSNATCVRWRAHARKPPTECKVNKQTNTQWGWSDLGVPQALMCMLWEWAKTMADISRSINFHWHRNQTKKKANNNYLYRRINCVWLRFGYIFICKNRLGCFFLCNLVFRGNRAGAGASERARARARVRERVRVQCALSSRIYEYLITNDSLSSISFKMRLLNDSDYCFFSFVHSFAGFMKRFSVDLSLLFQLLLSRFFLARMIRSHFGMRTIEP